MKRTEELRIVRIDELVPYAGNARTHSKEQIQKLRSSLREFGFVNPILVDKDYTIVAGHGRVLAAKAEGMEEVPCVMVEHLTEAQKKAYIIADNRLAEDVREDDFDVDAALEEEPLSKLGDLWLLGPHRLLCGDSTREETYTTLMDGKKANLVVTDPPYNVDYEGGQGKIENDNMSDEEFYSFLLEAFSGMAAAMSNDASIYVFHSDTKGLIFRSAFSDAGFYLSGVCHWVKQSLVLGRSPYQWRNEPVLYGWQQKGKHKWYAGRSETTIWEFDRPSRSESHPTMKPIPLIAYPIKNSSAVNGIVLDPFSGSASTLIASDQIDRICYAVELDPKFVDVGVKRYIEQAGGDAEVYLMRDGEKAAYADVADTDA